MIFVVDPNGSVGAGDDIVEAIKDYDSTRGDYSFSQLTVFEGTEVSIEFVLTPKVVKASK